MKKHIVLLAMAAISSGCTREAIVRRSYPSTESPTVINECLNQYFDSEGRLRESAATSYDTGKARHEKDDTLSYHVVANADGTSALQVKGRLYMHRFATWCTHR